MRQPFAGAAAVALVPPRGDPTIGGVRPLLELEPGETHALLGAPASIVDDDPGSGPRWLFRVDPAVPAPTIAHDVEDSCITSTAADVDGLLETMNLLPTLLRTDAYSAEATDCESLDEAVQRIAEEVADTYPGFALRGLDWDAICERHVPALPDADDPLAVLQEWVAELEDGHSWVLTRPPPANLPYSLRLDAGEATFVRVGPRSAGAAAGVEPGWRLVALDDAAVDAGRWLARTGSPPHSRPYVAGRRLLQSANGTLRSLVAESGAGVRAQWEEETAYVPYDEVVRWRKLDPSTGYLRIEVWLGDGSVDSAVDAAIGELRGCERLVLDLRANPGGNLVLACATRDRFLREGTAIGSARYTVGGGAVSAAFPITAHPSTPERRWTGDLVVLTDPLTYSSSEDFLLGLQGLPHVRVVGRPSGGGSGRPRMIRLVPGLQLMLSTALTYDRQGHCIEGAGVPVDVPIDTDLHGPHDHVVAGVL